MADKILIEKIDQLPDGDKKRLEKIVDTLLKEAKEHLNSGEKKERQFGGLKGAFGELPDDFDEPLEDFKDYM